MRLNLLIASCLLVPFSVLADDDVAEEQPQDTKPVTLNIGNCKIAGRADLLLITSDELAAAWNEFSTWKTKTGRPTKIVKISDIDELYAGNDIQEKIRACCLSHIEHQNTRWVILGGDSRGRKGGHVPDRDTNHVDFYKYKNLPTDIYYLSATDWDANDDQIYGQFQQDMDEVSYTNPKASLGRIPVRTVDNVVAYTEKVIEYESKYPKNDFATRMIYTCAVEHANPKLETSKDVVTGIWESGDVNQFFVDETPWDEEEDGDYDLTADNWVTMINNQQAAKIHMHGHGLIRQWVLENDSIATGKTVELLKNKSAYPVMTTVSCFTGQFDSYRDPCIAESMIRKDAGGAIAIIAPSREGIPVFHEKSDFRLMMTEGKMDGTTETLTRFWQHALENNMTIGDAFRAAKQDMTTHARKTDGYHFVQCELNLLGDPTLDVRAQVVSDIDAKVNVANQSNRFEVTVSGAKGCQVCLWNGSDQYEIQQADTNGRTVFHLTEKPGDSTFLSASAPNKNIWIEQVTSND